jgi:uncharacterized protein (TIGR00730 family)
MTPEDRRHIEELKRSPSYVMAYEDLEFLNRRELRPVRLQLELLKPELVQNSLGIRTTIVIFGSARIPEPVEAQRALEEAEALLAKSPRDPALLRRVDVARRIREKSAYYDQAKRFSRIVSQTFQAEGKRDLVVVTGGGPGIMEAANRGAYEAGAYSIGHNITLPHEQEPNAYITPELCFQFHYFALRKMHFLLRAKALVVFPGGFGTCDELFETLTLIQTGKMPPIPIILFGQKYWDRAIDFAFFVEEGMISPEDRNLFQFAETAEEAWEKIARYYSDRGGLPHMTDENGRVSDGHP